MIYLIHGVNRAFPRVVLAAILSAMAVVLPGLFWLESR
jgi:hypothetical protein